MLSLRHMMPSRRALASKVSMIVERDACGPYDVRGTAGDGHDGWQIQIWLPGSDPDGPEDHKFRVINGTVLGSDVDAEELDAVLALIDQWEERLPLMVASPIKF